MKIFLGIISMLVGIFFLAQLLIWGPAYSIEQQSLKWMVGGFGWLFIILGAIAFPSNNQNARESNLTTNQAGNVTEDNSKTSDEEIRKAEEFVRQNQDNPLSLSQLKKRNKWY